LVVAEGESREEEIKKSIQMIDQDKFIGTVLNKSDEVKLADDAY